MIVGICKVDLALHEGHSLKEKRRIVRKIKDSVLGRFKIPVSEVGFHDLWQRAELGFAVVGSSKSGINSIMDKILGHIAASCGGYVVDKKFEFVHFHEGDI